MKRAPVIPSLYAPDIEATLEFYVDVLGFVKTGEWRENETVSWAEVSLGASQIWFFKNALDDQPKPQFSGLIYVIIDDVDAMAVRLTDKADIKWGPETQEYGLRELGIEDNNGYYIVFAQDS